VHVLGVQAAHLDPQEAGSRPSEDGYSWLEWTVDGASLRSIYASAGPGESAITMLQARDAEDEPLRTESLLRLRGDDIPSPTFAPHYHRTRLDRLLHLRGTPVAPSGTAYQDGRVGLLFCYCGDLDCGALTARVEVQGETVSWRDIGWQVTYEPYVPYDEGQDWLGHRDLIFDRAQYESLINSLLDADWSQGLPQLHG
jgi:hypothetical protein